MNIIKAVLYYFVLITISLTTSAQNKELYQIKTCNLKSESQLTVTEN